MVAAGAPLPLAELEEPEPLAEGFPSGPVAVGLLEAPEPEAPEPEAVRVGRMIEVVLLLADTVIVEVVLSGWPMVTVTMPVVPIAGMVSAVPTAVSRGG